MQHNLTTTADLIAYYEARIKELTWNSELNMLNGAGIRDQIAHLPIGRYVVIFADIDRMKAINSATGSHVQTNRYLREGLKVRRGELAGQLYGDEIVFILAEGSDAAAFINRISLQLAAQPLTVSERRALIQAGNPPRLSATFAYNQDVCQDEIVGTIEQLSRDVLARKAERDARRAA